METKSRINYIDYTKGYGILIVALSHVLAYFSYTHFLFHYIESYHMTLFFIIGGILNTYKSNDSESWCTFISKRYRGLIIPYIYFSLFNTVLKFTVLLISNGLTKEIFHQEMIELFILGNGTVWFLSVLFLTELLYKFVSQFEKNILPVFFALICVSICFFVEGTNNPFIAVLLRVLAAYSFYTSGVVLGNCILKKHSVHICWGFFLLLLGIFSFYKLGSDYSFFYAKFKNPIGSLLSIYLNSVGCIIIFKNINSEFKLWLYFGKNSLIIMLMHTVILLFYTYPAKGSYDLLPCITQWVTAFSVFATIILINMPIIKFINNKIPFVIGKKRDRLG